MSVHPYKALTMFGEAYGVVNPYINYGALAAKCFAAAQKREGYTWNLYLQPENLTLRPAYVDLLKNTEAELPDLLFKSEPYVALSPQEIREREDLLVITSAQFLDAYARGEELLRDVRFQGIDFAYEQYTYEQLDSLDPFVGWDRDRRQVYAGWDRTYFRHGEFAVCAAVSKP